MWGVEGSDVPQDESENECDQSGLSKTGCGSPAASDLRQGRQQRSDATAGAGIVTEVDEVRYGLLVTRCVT
ncbi:hypothetical protein [Azoarcus sp. CIB]|uniref:hypothetical protein n=1 Tax=Aromatoleum sp. (strain CIB) TaxID=198107 RepID=UPI00067C1985|nr:hypothetical protein [Azoarcus sp. CIB]